MLEGFNKRTKAALATYNNTDELGRNVSLELSQNDPLKPDVDEDVLNILVIGAEGLSRNVVALVRLKCAMTTGFEEVTGAGAPKTRFFVLVFGPTSADESERRIRIGTATAALLQDDSVATMTYKATEPEQIIDVMQRRLLEFHIIPHTMRPTTQGMKRRARKMLKQMQAVRNLGKTPKTRTQMSRWRERQEGAFDQGFSLDAIVIFFQKYALPLLLGIALGLLIANVDEETYDKWAGHRRRLGGGGDDGHAADRPNFFDVSFNGHVLNLHFIVNDIGMSLFFGLAAKEITEAFQPGGSLYPPTRSTVNVLMATIGGVAGPVLVYLLSILIFSSIGILDDKYSFADYATGWGIPTATDISLAWVSALCVFGAGHPAINYLLLLAIIDDGIGLIIIALAYPDPEKPFQPWWLFLCLAGTLIAYMLRRANCSRWQVYVCIAGPISWLGLLYAGLHPSLALVFVVPMMPLHIHDELSWLWRNDTESGHQSLNDAEPTLKHSPLHDFEEAVKNVVDFVILFLFGAVNAGIKVDSVGGLTWVVLLSLVVGKMLGIGVASMVSKALGCPPPPGMSFKDILLVGFIASAGLTVALFVAGEAFGELPALAAQAKMGALLSVVVALTSIVGASIKSHLLKRADDDHDFDKASTCASEASTEVDEVNDDETLEMVIAESAIKNLRLIQQAEKEVEHRAQLTRLQTMMRIQEIEGEVERRRSQESLHAPTSRSSSRSGRKKGDITKTSPRSSHGLGTSSIGATQAETSKDASPRSHESI